MKLLKNTVLPVLLSTIWISISEFVRNEYIVKSLWLKHYKELGLTFPSAPVNGGVWGIWSLLFAIGVFVIAKKFTLIQTTFISWFLAFLMMWVAIGNLGVLPFGILIYAIPLSIFESFIAALIIKSFRNK